MNKRICISILIVLITVLLPSYSFSKIGVGINTGKIQVDEKLKSGMIYTLPSVTIINTGDQPGDYEASVAYHMEQPELRPDKDWFIFTPRKFHLEPGKGQIVEIKLNLPIKTQPGNYFAYLEGHPLATVENGSTSLGVAAAAKLYFTVEPANIIYGIYYKAVTFFKVYAPWPQRGLMGLAVLILLATVKKFFHIQINVKSSGPSNSKDPKEDPISEIYKR